MISREDLVFATVYQLAEMIREDWEDRSAEVDFCLQMLRPIDEPDGSFIGAGLDDMSQLKLKAYETMPESVTTKRRLQSLIGVIKMFQIVLKYSDGWNTEDSVKLKKELNLRINNYEDEIKQITKIEPANRLITI